MEYRIRDDDPLSARAETEWCETTVRGAVEARTALHATLRATATSFEIQASLDAFESDALVCRREWQETIPRDLV